MDTQLYPPLAKNSRANRRSWRRRSQRRSRRSARVFAEGALPTKTKQFIAVAVAHVTQCPYCIRGHTELAVNHGATEQG